MFASAQMLQSSPAINWLEEINTFLSFSFWRRFQFNFPRHQSPHAARFLCRQVSASILSFSCEHLFFSLIIFFFSELASLFFKKIIFRRLYFVIISGWLFFLHTGFKSYADLPKKKGRFHLINSEEKMLLVI